MRKFRNIIEWEGPKSWWKIIWLPGFRYTDCAPKRNFKGTAIDGEVVSTAFIAIAWKFGAEGLAG